MSEIIKNLDLKSLNISEDKKSKLKELFPEVFSEDKIDFDKLKLTLGEDIADNEERFGLQWAGKKDCFKVIQEPSVGTLKPCKEESVNWNTTENLFIEGDNLEVLKQLQKAYYGKVKMIYIDPPYNTGGEFIYPDRFQENLDTYLAYTGQVNDEGKKFSTNTETSGRFHSNWLNMMYPRLFLAKNLLKNDGVIFISIGADELSNLITLTNEIFGEENRAGICVRQAKTGGNTGKFFSPNVEYILVYSKDLSKCEGFKIEMDEELIKKVYTKIETEGLRKGEKYRTMGLYQASLKDLRPNQKYFIECPDGSLVLPPCSIQDETMRTGDGRWRWTKPKFLDELAKGNVLFIETNNGILVDKNGENSKWNIYTKIWLNDRQDEGQVPNDLILKYENRHSSKELQEIDIPFDFAKPSELISYLIKIAGIKNDDIILDFFAGSATTAHSVFKINKEYDISSKFICVQLPEPTDLKSAAFNKGYKTIADIGKERIRRVIKKIETEVQEEEIKNQGKLELDDNKQKNKLDLGFKVFKLDRSNFKTWDGNTENDGIQNQLEKALFHIDTKSSEKDILTEILLKSGFQLTVKMEEITLVAKKVFSIADGSLIVCLDKDITKELIQEIAKLEPARVVCLDSGFKERDELKTNAIQIMKSHGVDDFRTV
jgi:adenine-specific DNA-methyltransferase